MRHSTHGGFSLVELIVVLGIVVVLIAILLPTVSAVRRASKVTQCASNLREIGQAIFMYRTASRTWPSATPIPLPFVMPGEAATPTIPEVLASYLSPDSAVYHCPGDVEQVFKQCASVPGGHGISYVYWVPFQFPRSSQAFQSMMADFQGYSGPARTVTVSQFHPPHRGMNELQLDGSVHFGYANLAGP